MGFVSLNPQDTKTDQKEVKERRGSSLSFYLMTSFSRQIKHKAIYIIRQ